MFFSKSMFVMSLVEIKLHLYSLPSQKLSLSQAPPQYHPSSHFSNTLPWHTNKYAETIKLFLSVEFDVIFSFHQKSNTVDKKFYAAEKEENETPFIK